MTNFDITSFFKRTSEKNLSNNGHAEQHSAHASAPTGTTQSPPPGLASSSTAAAAAAAATTTTTTTTGLPPPGLGLEVSGDATTSAAAADALTRMIRNASGNSSNVVNSSSSGGNAVLSANGASLLPTNAHRVSYDTTTVWNSPVVDSTIKNVNNDSGGSNNNTVVVHQPHTTPIAHVASSLPPPMLPRGTSFVEDDSDDEEKIYNMSSNCGGNRLIDWNNHFTVYVVKGGLIRVIDRQTGSRSLLRGHSVKGQTSYVRDMVFFNKSSDILATVGTLPGTINDGTTTATCTGILIWRLYRIPNSEEVSQECLLELRCNSGSSEASQITWHPTNTNVFAVSHGTKITIVESTKLQTTPIADNTTGQTHAMCILAGSLSSSEGNSISPGQLVLGDRTNGDGSDDGQHTDVILDICWCYSNPTYLYSCGFDGTVRVWDVQAPFKCLWTIHLLKELSSSTTETSNNGMIATRCISFGGGGGTMNSNGGSPPGLLPVTAESGSYPTLLVSSYDLTNHMTTLSMFSNTTFDISMKPSLSHVLDFVAYVSPPPLFCLSICHPLPETNSGMTQSAQKGVYILVSQLNNGGVGPTSGGNIPRSTSDNSTPSPLMFVIHSLSMPQYKFVKITPYKLLYPLLSWSIGSTLSEYDHSNGDDDNVNSNTSANDNRSSDGDKNEYTWDISTFVVQTKAVQVLQVSPGQCSVSSSLLSSLSGNEIGQGVTIVTPGATSITSNDVSTTSPMASNTNGDTNRDISVIPAANKSNHTMENVELYDMEGEEDDDEEEEEEEEDDHHDDEDHLPPTSSITAIEGVTTTTVGGSFTNWLGAIAAPRPPVVSDTTNNNTSNSVSSSSPSTNAQTNNSSSNKLLTPTEILGASSAVPMSTGGKKPSTGATTNASESQQTNKNKGQKTKNNRKSKSPQRPGRNKTPTKKAGSDGNISATTNGGPATSSTKQQQQQQMGSNKKGSSNASSTNPQLMTVNAASTPGQVKILKRQEPPVPPAAPTSQTKVAPPPPPPPPPGVTAKEMEECVSRVITSTMTDHNRILMKNLQDEMITKLTSTMDTQYKVQSNRLTQSVSSKVSSSVKDPLKEAFYSTMREVMIPAMEATTQQMLTQVSKVVEDHLSHIQQQRTQDEATARHVMETSTNVAKLVQTVESLTHEVARLQKQVADSSTASASAAAAITAAATNMQTTSAAVAAGSAIHGANGPAGAGGGASGGPPGLGVGPGQQQQRAMSGGFPSMVSVQTDPYATLRQEMLTNLNQRKYEAAFTQALSSNNAEMTKFCCRNVDMFSVFGNSQEDGGGGNVKLSQPILLCILQQLGSTLGSSPPHGAQQDVKMELEWMQEIALSLNGSDPSIRRHVPQVVSQLMGNIETKLAQGDPALRRALQTLLQVIRGISY